jgi:hypothetical protein
MQGMVFFFGDFSPLGFLQAATITSTDDWQWHGFHFNSSVGGA